MTSLENTIEKTNSPEQEERMVVGAAEKMMTKHCAERSRSARMKTMLAVTAALVFGSLLATSSPAAAENQPAEPHSAISARSVEQAASKVAEASAEKGEVTGINRFFEYWRTTYSGEYKYLVHQYDPYVYGRDFEERLKKLAALPPEELGISPEKGEEEARAKMTEEYTTALEKLQASEPERLFGLQDDLIVEEVIKYHREQVEAQRAKEAADEAFEDSRERTDNRLAGKVYPEVHIGSYQDAHGVAFRLKTSMGPGLWQVVKNFPDAVVMKLGRILTGDVQTGMEAMSDIFNGVDLEQDDVTILGHRIEKDKEE